MGACLRNEGYQTVGEALMVVEPVFPSDRRFPRLRDLRDRGFEDDPVEPVMYFMDWIGFIGEPADELFIEYLAESPEFQIPPTADAIAAFQEAYFQNCLSDVYGLAAFGSAQELQIRWFQAVDEMHKHTDLMSAARELWNCLEQSKFNIGDMAIESFEELLVVEETYFLASAGVSAFEELNLRPDTSGAGLHAAGREYAECMEPFIEARRPILAAERERLVQEKFGTLLAMEELFDALLEG